MDIIEKIDKLLKEDISTTAIEDQIFGATDFLTSNIRQVLKAFVEAGEHTGEEIKKFKEMLKSLRDTLLGR